MLLGLKKIQIIYVKKLFVDGSKLHVETFFILGNSNTYKYQLRVHGLKF